MVILLVTGNPCAGKGLFANILKEKYGYTVRTVNSALTEKIWDFKNKCPVADSEQAIIQETKELIELSLQNWNVDQVIYPILYPASVDQIMKKRSYFKIIGIVAPTQNRYEFLAKSYPQFKDISKKELMMIDDHINFTVGVEACMSMAEFLIFNKAGKAELEEEISKHDRITKKIYRPSWDVYFMKLAHVVRERSNCMKRSVGSVVVQDNRIVSTGYNGTPSDIKNCYQGGCVKCNDCLKGFHDLCNCIHAEEAAILECGVHRAEGGTVYTTNAPCRWCIKILIQAKIARLVYAKSGFNQDLDKLLEESNIKVDCLSEDL